MTSKKPLISVIIPSYNHAGYVGRAIQSVVEQDYRPLELIILDDGSKDASVDVIKRKIASIPKSPGLTVHFEASENSGAHETINRGMKLAKGSFLTILNSDDYFFPKRLSTLCSTMITKKTDLIFSEVQHIDDKDQPLSSTHPMCKWYEEAIKKTHLKSVGFHLLTCNIAVTTGNLLFTRALWYKLGGFKNYQLMHDYDFLLRALFYTEPVFFRKALMAYRAHANNTCVQMNHLGPGESAQIAFDFVKNSILNPRPDNNKAPCVAYWQKTALDFWEDEPTWIRSWLGDENPASLFL